MALDRKVKRFEVAAANRRPTGPRAPAAKAVAAAGVKPRERVKFTWLRRLPDQPPLRHARESLENPIYVDQMVETAGGETLTKYEQKVAACGGALAFSVPE